MAAESQHRRSRNLAGATTARRSRNLAALPPLLLPLVLPLGYFWPLAAAAEGVVPRYVAPGIHATDAVVVALLVTALVRRRGAAIDSRQRWLLPLLGLCLLGLLSLPGALSQGVALRAVARWLLAAGACSALISARLPPRRLALIFCIGLALQVGIETLQLRAQGPVGVWGELQLAPGQLGAAILDIGGEHWVRPYGLTFHPNLLGGLLGVGLIVGLPLIGEVRWFGALWSVLVFGWLCTFSRSAWLATAPLVAGLTVWLARRHSGRRPALGRALLGAALATVVWLALFPQQLAVRFGGAASGVARLAGVAGPAATDSEQRSVRERSAMNELALRLAVARPLSGIGAGNFPLAMMAAATPAAPQFAHNVPLLLAAEVGVAGALLWMAISVVAILRLLKPAPLSAHRAAALCGLLALGAVALFDSYPWALDEGRLLLALLLALASGEESAPGPTALAG